MHKNKLPGKASGLVNLGDFSEIGFCQQAVKLTLSDFACTQSIATVTPLIFYGDYIHLF